GTSRPLRRDALLREGSSRQEADKLAVRARVIHLGVETPTGPNRHVAARTILCPAGLVAVKGHTYLLQAMPVVVRQEPRVVLQLAGEGRLRGKLLAEVRRLGVDHHVQFLGHVQRAELLATYSRGEVACVVLPSIVLGPGH